MRDSAASVLCESPVGGHPRGVGLRQNEVSLVIERQNLSGAVASPLAESDAGKIAVIDSVERRHVQSFWLPWHRSQKRESLVAAPKESTLKAFSQ
jgi:hypothetical protein